MNVAVVVGEWLSVKVTGAGPLTTDHVVDRVLPGGCPSSLAVPARATCVLDWTIGAIAAGPNAVCSRTLVCPICVLSNVTPFQLKCQIWPLNSSEIRMSPTMSLNCDADAPTTTESP